MGPKISQNVVEIGEKCQIFAPCFGRVKATFVVLPHLATAAHSSKRGFENPTLRQQH
jgi:hypothetical protein